MNINLKDCAVLFSLASFIAWGGLTIFFIFYVPRHIDLKPKVDENFFFSSGDPQFQEDKKISKIFLQEQQIILSAGGDIYSPDYLRKVGELTAALSAIPQVDSVQSLTHGPGNTDDAPKSPIWKRFLFSSDKKASFIYVFMKRNASMEAGVLRIEKVRQRFEAPDFLIMISGAPYIVELIGRNLLSCHGLLLPGSDEDSLFLSLFCILSPPVIVLSLLADERSCNPAYTCTGRCLVKRYGLGQIVGDPLV
jgi:predicted RND superfamily exporter protein